MSDPYGRKYVTAGNPYVAADGQTLVDVSRDVAVQFANQYGNEDAPIVYAQQVNLALLSQGRAIQTNDGVMGMDLLRQIVQQHGYVGPNDLSSWAQFYNALKTPPPATPVPSGSATISVRTGLGGLPTPVLIGGGVLLLLLLGGRGRLL